MPKHFMYPEGPETSNFTSNGGSEYITVLPNIRENNDVFIGIAMDFDLADRGEAWAGVDADKLRDAIDKAMGPREGAESPVAKPYRPIDRDRLLRHISDIEATLTRRNRRHEEDQEKIREVLGQNEHLMERVEELEEIAMRRGDEIEELEAKLDGPSSEEQLERLSVGLEAKLNPPRLLDTHDSKGKGIPAIEVERVVAANEDPYSRSFRFYEAGDDFGWWGRAEEVLALGLSAEDFKPFDPRRKEYEDKGLEPWEIEILMGANA